MADLKGELQNLDVTLMEAVVRFFGSTDISPENATTAEKLQQHPALQALFLGLKEQASQIDMLSKRERIALLIGAGACLEILIDYANAEEVQAVVSRAS